MTRDKKPEGWLSRDEFFAELKAELALTKKIRGTDRQKAQTESWHKKHSSRMYNDAINDPSFSMWKLHKTGATSPQEYICQHVRDLVRCFAQSVLDAAEELELHEYTKEELRKVQVALKAQTYASLVQHRERKLQKCRQ